MPGRKIPLITGHYYHIFNRGIDKQPMFTQPYEMNRMIEIIDYYRYTNNPVSYSHFLELNLKQQQEIMRKLRSNPLRVTILAFAIMTNHFHLLVRQESNGGISKFVGDIINSYTRYYNLKHGRLGSLFQGKFKSVLVETEAQLLHLSRYINLNPYTDHVTKNHDEHEIYPYTSFPDYIDNPRSFINTNIVLANFKKQGLYRRFVWSHSDYQRKLSQIKHLLLEIYPWTKSPRLSQSTQ